MDVKKTTSHLHTCLDREAIVELRGVLEWEGLFLGWDHQFGCSGFGGRGFDTGCCFLLWFPSSRLSACCRFSHGIFSPCRLPVNLGCVSPSVIGCGKD